MRSVEFKMSVAPGRVVAVDRARRCPVVRNSEALLFLIFVSEERATYNHKQNAVTFAARGGSELKLPAAGGE